MRRRLSNVTLGGAALGLLVVAGALQTTTIFPRWRRDYSPVSNGNGVVTQGLSPDQMIFALAGFREMLAGILWVRADSFFDSGNYDAILPIVRLVTILDPHQIDVFTTGMWHIAYNFTDEEQRSDRRYIPNALALGKEGIRNNPDTYELFFETGWIWYHKINDDYGKAVGYFNDAYKRPDILTARKNLLSVALQRDGKIAEALANYYRLLDDAENRLKKNPNDYQARQNRDTLENLIDTLIVRMSQRGFFAVQQKRPLTGYDINPPFDVGFSAKVSVVDRKVLRVEGTWNVLPVGTRIRFILRDQNYPGAGPAIQNWDANEKVNLDPPRDLTYLQDDLFVRNRRFNRRIDMSKDVTMYPLSSENYYLEFYYNPRSAALHIQDKFGWSGEGMTDKNFLNKDIRPGMNVIYARLPISRDMLLRQGEWLDKTPVVKTSNYIEVGSDYNKTDTLLDVPGLNAPSLRSEAPVPKLPPSSFSPPAPAPPSAPGAGGR